jgi:hypothetical protein
VASAGPPSRAQPVGFLLHLPGVPLCGGQQAGPLPGLRLQPGDPGPLPIQLVAQVTHLLIDALEFPCQAHGAVQLGFQPPYLARGFLQAALQLRTLEPSPLQLLPEPGQVLL